MLQTFGRDKYGRKIPDALLPDGTNVNHSLVKDGWSWRYREYAPGDIVLEGLEKDTREAKKGLRADSDLVPPWEWWKTKYCYLAGLFLALARLDSACVALSGTRVFWPKYNLVRVHRHKTKLARPRFLDLLLLSIE